MTSVSPWPWVIFFKTKKVSSAQNAFQAGAYSRLLFSSS